MNRKEFIQYSLATAAGLSLWDRLSFASALEAAALSSANRLLINVLLEGGPDFLHLIVPKPSADTTSYSYKYWNNRTRTIARGTSVNNFNSWNSAYTSDYEEITQNGQTFGVLKGDRAASKSYNGWLISQIKAGKVAIICNVRHSTSRDHSNSQMIVQSGLYGSSPLQTSNAGWGGLLMNQGTLTGKRLLSMSNPMRPFCNSNGANKAVSFTDSRNFGLTRSADLGTTEPTWDNRFRRLRAIKTYLSERNSTSPFTGSANNTLNNKFTAQYGKLSALTDAVKNTLNNTSNPQSMDIKNLYPASNNGSAGAGALISNANFGRQIANLYDALQVPSLNMAIASLAYGGWDSHKNQKADVEKQFDDLFGTNRAFDTLFKQTGGSSVFNNSTMMFYGEFGRQLKDNGDGGTDHGTGNFVFLIGGQVTGGVYGNMFPDKDKNNFDFGGRDISADITRKHSVTGAIITANDFTGFDPLINKVASWLNSGPLILGLNAGDANVNAQDTTAGITSFTSLLP
jgi:uncharacterized protein (DUF1501 family)